MNKEDYLITPTELADYLKIRPQTLAVWRSKGDGGPVFAKINGKIRYRWSDVLAFVASRVVENSVQAQQL